MTLTDAIELAAIAGGVTFAAFAIGAAVLRAQRRRSIGAQIVVLVVSTVIAVIAGAFAASRAMFISHHDLVALTVVLISAGVVAIAIGLWLGARLGAASRSLVATARRLGDDDNAQPSALERSAPAELTQLATNSRRRKRVSTKRGPGKNNSSRRVGSWLPGCRTISEHRSQACARSSKRSKTVSSTTR